MAMEFTTGVGRLVSGSAFEGQDKDRKGQPYVIKTGPNAGKPTKKFFFAVAFPKVLANGQPNEEFNKFYRDVIDVARGGYPQFFAGPIDAFTGKPGHTHPRMAFKIADGDGIDSEGKPNNQKEGWAGHWVVKFSGSYAPRCFEVGKFLPEQQITDPTRVKRGYYVAVSGTVDANIGSDVPGVYMNGNMVCLIGAGPEIVSGPDASAAFAGLNVTNLPAGCVVGATPANAAPALPNAVPPAPGVPSVPAVPGMLPNATVSVPHDPVALAVANGWVPHPSAPGHFYKGQEVKTQADIAAMFPAPVAAPPAVPAIPAAPVVPNVGFVANAGVPVVPPAPVGIMLNAAAVAQGYTLEMFRAQGYTDDMIRQSGFAA
jgi:hypothetical protein